MQYETNSEWVAHTFIVPKKNRTVRFISDFRELNETNKRRQFSSVLKIGWRRTLLVLNTYLDVYHCMYARTTVVPSLKSVLESC